MHQIIPSPNTQSIIREFFGNNADIIFPSLKWYKSCLVIITESMFEVSVSMDGKYNDASPITV